MITDINGVEINANDFKDDELGTMMLASLVGCLIKKDDTVYKLKLNFGTSVYEVRIPELEFSEETKGKAWEQLLTNAFSAHELGKQMRGMKDIRVEEQESKPTLVTN